MIRVERFGRAAPLRTMAIEPPPKRCSAGLAAVPPQPHPPPPPFPHVPARGSGITGAGGARCAGALADRPERDQRLRDGTGYRGPVAHGEEWRKASLRARGNEAARLGWIFRTIVRQQRRAMAARGCMTIVLFVVLVVVGMMFILPLLLRLLPLVPTTHP